MLFTVFIILQTITALLMILHDWVHLPPLTNIIELKKHSTPTGRICNTLMFIVINGIPIGITSYYASLSMPQWAKITITTVYAVLTVGTITAWWIPYFFGSSDKQKEGFIEYKNTHHFLPARENNTIPNTMHVILHLFIWSCLAFSLYLL